MTDKYDNIETFIRHMDGPFSNKDAEGALPKLVSAILGERVKANGGEIVAICELVLQIVTNGVEEMDPEMRERMLPEYEMARQFSRVIEAGPRN